MENSFTNTPLKTNGGKTGEQTDRRTGDELTNRRSDGRVDRQVDRHTGVGITSVLVEDGQRRRGLAGVPKPHGAVGRAGQEAAVGGAVGQTPDNVRVATQRPPQNRGFCSGTNTPTIQ